jgi:succinate dehydrogenase / fumarate reductase membrane anchor subunit
MKKTTVEYKTPLKQAAGLGSARDGTHHFIMQRLSAFMLIPLVLWFVVNLIRLAHAPYAEIMLWMQNPISGVLLISLLLAAAWHSLLGIQVVIEDYIHSPFYKISTLVLMYGFIGFFTVLGVFFVLRIVLA